MSEQTFKNDSNINTEDMVLNGASASQHPWCSPIKIHTDGEVVSKIEQS